MFQFKKYVLASSLEEAYELNQKRSNVILGGMGWLKMGDRQFQTAIDLSNLGLDEIVETETEFQIGCMVTLHDLECHEGLEEFFQGAVKESVRHIVGVQFRNCATIGGSIYGRFGFSDPLTLFLATDCFVELFHAGVVSLEEFVKMPYDRDILVRVIIKKKPGMVNYVSFRNQATDFPVLTCAYSDLDGKHKIVLGARPAKAGILMDEEHLLDGMENASEEQKESQVTRFARWAAEQFTYGSNLRGSAEYREMIAKVLIKRCILNK